MEKYIFKCAKEGALRRLKSLLDQKPQDAVAMLVSTHTERSTPLIMACKYGHLDVVKYLLEKCHADIEQVGFVKFGCEVVQDVHPLWCAAAAGHLEIVKELIKYKASVNSTTKTNSTALRAACYDGKLEIVKCLIKHGADTEIANSDGHTCLMLACKQGFYAVSRYLLECGADVHKKSNKKKITALHECGKSGNWQIFELLLRHGAMQETDHHGVTPLLIAAANQHASVVQYFINEYHCSKQDQINALELLGATFADHENMIQASYFWRWAISWRNEETDKFLFKTPDDNPPIASCIGRTEVRTLHELENLNPEEMCMQALLVRERILSSHHPLTVHYIRRRGATFARTDRFAVCFELWMYALDVQQQVQHPLSSKTHDIFIDFYGLLSTKVHETNANDISAVLFYYILSVSEKAIKEIKRATKEMEGALNISSQDHVPDLDMYRSQDHVPDLFSHILTITVELVALMCKLRPHLNENENKLLKEAAHKLVHMNLETDEGLTLLHLACSEDSQYFDLVYPIQENIPSLEVVDLFLELGAYPNAVDAHNSTPLHFAAMNDRIDIFNSLLNHGAHLDGRNSKNDTPLQSFNSYQMIDQLDINIQQHLNLQCLCAQSVNMHQIPYEGIVPKRIQTFLNLHCSYNLFTRNVHNA